jgi:hypothetical protein
MMKKNYETPEIIELIAFQAADVITVSEGFKKDPYVIDW